MSTRQRCWVESMKKTHSSDCKRLIFFSRDLTIGGMEKALVCLLNALSKQNHQITLVLEKKDGVLLEQLDKNISVKEYSLSQCSFIPLRKLINLFHRVFWGIFHYHRYDFSCNYATYSVIGSKLALIASKNSALYVHSNYPAMYQGAQAAVTQFFNTICIDSFQHIIFVSNEGMEATRNYFPSLSSRFTVINNLVDYSLILREAEKECNVFGSENVNFLFVGRLDDSSKNFDLLIDSFKAAYKQSGNIRLVIVGDGPDRLKIQNRISREQIKGIHLLGETPNPYPFIKKCDCMILTSKYEGYPVVYTEALVFNKPFITTVPVSDDFIDVRNHFVICRPDHCEIADEMLKTQKSKLDYQIDFEIANTSRIEQIEKLF